METTKSKVESIDGFYSELKVDSQESVQKLPVQSVYQVGEQNFKTPRVEQVGRISRESLESDAGRQPYRNKQQIDTEDDQYL